MTSLTDWQDKAKLLRNLILSSTTTAASGHVTSSLSAVELGTVLFDKYFTYDLDNPKALNNDRFILSKGHATPLFYALYAMSGAFPLKDLETLRKFGSPLEGHPTPHFKYTDAATGSLGQGLSVGCGMAYRIKQEFEGSERMPHVYVMLGDGELAEGQIWEAANFASYYKLNNVVAIADINRLGQSQQTMFGHHMDAYQKRFEAFGFETVVIDGHNLEEVDQAYTQAQQHTSEKPFVIIAETSKGKGISFLEDKDNWHGKALKKEELEKALIELGEVDDTLRFTLRKPSVNPISQVSTSNAPPDSAEFTFKDGDQFATREVYGKVLTSLASQNPHLYSLDADMKNSTFSEDFLKIYPDRFIECFIAEQNMVGVAMGLSRLQEKPFVSTFASFLIRAADQIRMAAISKANIAFVGAHVGVSIGEDGPSQMGLEDVALFGTIPDSIIFQPSDAVSMSKVLPHLENHEGISYLRMLRPKTPVIYAMDEDFVIGGSKVLRHSSDDELTIVSAGITLHEALKAQAELAQENIHVRVIDCYSLKPIDKDTLLQSLKETKRQLIVTVEDHYAHGGLGDLVLSAVSGSGAMVVKLAVPHLSRSGTKEELLKDAQIDSSSIVQTVKNLLD